MDPQTISLSIDDNDLVSVLDTGKFLEVTYLEQRSTRSSIKKVSKDFYLDLREATGELHLFEHHDLRIENYDTIRRSLKLARDRINFNCVIAENIKWITLTYKELVTDPEIVYRDFKVFVKSVRRIFGKFEYIVCCEPQERGAWHLHCIFIFPSKSPYMANSDVFRLWGRGFVNVQNVNNISNLGAYLSAYMTDVPMPDGYEENINPGNIFEKEVNGVKKKFIKGARLSFYPSGMHIFRYSRGIKTPELNHMSYKEFKKIFPYAQLTYEKNYHLLNDDPDSDFSCYIKKEYYNK